MTPKNQFQLSVTPPSFLNIEHPKCLTPKIMTANLISVHNKSLFLQKYLQNILIIKNIDFRKFSHKKFIFGKYNSKIDIFEFIDKNIDSTSASV